MTFSVHGLAVSRGIAIGRAVIVASSRVDVAHYLVAADEVEGEIDRLRLIHPRIVLYDAHSIRSHVERLFDGELPALNLGTNSGASADAGAVAIAEKHMAASGFTHVTNGRFKGGHITRHYGQPAQNIHAVQLEMTQCSYMQEALPFDYLPEVAAGVQPHLERLLKAALGFARAQTPG